MMEDAVVEGLSDRGSTPLRSTILRVTKKAEIPYLCGFQLFLLLEVKSFETVSDRFSVKKAG